MIGIIVSGRAVPTAASTEPTAPSASSSLRPNHSMPFVNSSAPSEDDDEARWRGSRRSTLRPPVQVAVTIATAMTARIAIATTTIGRSPRTDRTRRRATTTRTIGVDRRRAGRATGSPPGGGPGCRGTIVAEVERRAAAQRRDPGREHAGRTPIDQQRRPRRRCIAIRSRAMTAPRGRRPSARRSSETAFDGASATQCRAGPRRTARAGPGGRSGGRAASRRWRR